MSASEGFAAYKAARARLAARGTDPMARYEAEEREAEIAALVASGLAQIERYLEEA